MEVLNYRPYDKFCTAAATSKPIQVITAEKFAKVLDEPKTLEGTVFDREGNLYFSSTMGHAIYKLDVNTRELKTIWTDDAVRPASVKIHKNGQIYAACLSNEAMGGVLVMEPDGSDPHWILRGYSIDDLAFDDQGGFYFTEFIGDIKNPEGRVCYVNPEFTKVTTFCKNLCQPNGVALSTDGSILWVTEYQAQRLLRFNLKTGRSTVPYYFTGFAGPDSCEIDGDDNLYVALPEQGRVMVFNSWGQPIGQINAPGWEENRHSFITHMAIAPTSRDIYMCTKDIAKPSEGSWILKAQAYANGPVMFQHK